MNPTTFAQWHSSRAILDGRVAGSAYAPRRDLEAAWNAAIAEAVAYCLRYAARHNDLRQAALEVVAENILSELTSPRRCSLCSQPLLDEVAQPSAVDLAPMFKEQMRTLLVNRVRKITLAHLGDSESPNTVPIEARYLWVIRPEDEEMVRTMIDAVGGKVLLPTESYSPTRRILVGEIGYMWGASVIIDPDHKGAPRMYGQGARKAVVTL